VRRLMSGWNPHSAVPLFAGYAEYRTVSANRYGASLATLRTSLRRLWCDARRGCHAASNITRNPSAYAVIRSGDRTASATLTGIVAASHHGADHGVPAIGSVNLNGVFSVNATSSTTLRTL